MDFDNALFHAALCDPAHRPRAMVSLQKFLTAGGNPNLIRGDSARPLLVDSAKHEWDEAVGVLLAAGADVHANNDEALRWAAGGGCLPIVERLLTAGADVHARREAALHEAAQAGRLSVVSALLAARAAVHAQAEKALRLAVFFGHPSVVKCLIAAGATAADGGNNLMMYALHNADRESVRVLLAAGVSAEKGWRRCAISRERDASAMLNALADDIPPEQRAALIRMSPSRFPALRALRAAERRCGAGNNRIHRKTKGSRS